MGLNVQTKLGLNVHLNKIRLDVHLTERTKCTPMKIRLKVHMKIGLDVPNPSNRAECTH